MFKLRYIVLAFIAMILVGFSLNALWIKGFSAGPKKIIVVLKATEEIEFWRVLTDGVQTASKEFDVQASVIGPPKEIEVDLQISMIEQAIQENPDAIVMAAGDYNRLVPTAQKIRKAGIPLIMIDSDINGDYAESLISTDNIDAGEKAGREMAELLPPNAKVAIISYVQGTSTQIEREQGVRSILSYRKGTEIVGTYYSEGMEETAYNITKELLQKRLDLDGIVGLNEPSTVGAGRAIQELGLMGKVKLVGFDSSIAEVKLLEAGVLQSTVVQKPFSIGYLGVKTALSVLNGDKVPPEIYTDSVVIHKDNMYTEENQKLLFPFVEE
ncbi:substrate-binding domain-containing protein [Paenibacillus sp. EC2-1]|uniref:substrate-binding domain-containing protein n=1 Tax=Paenibacillus sp. EC2-1 TaxID=3388665 RepID=UPI003BEF2654